MATIRRKMGRFGALMVGFRHEIGGNFASVGGGRNRTAAGEFDWGAGRLVEGE
jgi:hypothetical protein